MNHEISGLLKNIIMMKGMHTVYLLYPIIANVNEKLTWESINWSMKKGGNFKLLALGEESVPIKQYVGMVEQGEIIT